MAWILTIFEPKKSQRRKLFDEKNSNDRNEREVPEKFEKLSKNFPQILKYILPTSLTIKNRGASWVPLVFDRFGAVFDRFGAAERFRNFAERFRNRSAKFRNRSAQSLSETQRKMSSRFALIPLKGRRL